MPSRSARRKPACEQCWLFPVGTTQEPCGPMALERGLESWVRPCREGGIAELGAGAGMLLEGLLGRDSVQQDSAGPTLRGPVSVHQWAPCAG